MKPYYQDEWVTIVLGDCREFSLPKCDMVVITDPPYPNQHREYGSSDISFLDKSDCKQLVFWSAKVAFPLSYTAIHKWNKLTGTYAILEDIYERNGSIESIEFKYQKIKNQIDAQMNKDILTGHPSQKPQRLISRLIIEKSEPNDLIFDPFLGSGTTAYCAKKLNRKCIGIEIEEKYCEIAANRCRQTVMDLRI